MTSDITVLLATCDRGNLIQPILDSLKNQTLPAEEIIILDQSSDNKTFVISQRALFNYIKLTEKNKSKAINLGIRKSKSKYIAIIDDDCIADIQWIENFSKVFNETNYKIVTGRVIAGETEQNSTKSRLHDEETNEKVYQKKVITPIFIMSGCNMAFEKNIINRLGYFDEIFGPGSPFLSSDDNEWSYRALSMGYKIFYEPAAIVTHRSWRSPEQDLQQMQSYGYATGAFFAKMETISKLDYFYHYCKLMKWLFIEQIKSIGSKKFRKSYTNYHIQLKKGFRNFNNGNGYTKTN